MKLSLILVFSLLVIIYPGFSQQNKTDGNNTVRTELRERLAEEIAAKYGINNRNIIEAFKRVPRDIFLPNYVENLAYKDTAIPLGRGEILPSPGNVAVILKNLSPERGSRVLIVGVNTGYTAALFARITSEVYVIEANKDRSDRNREIFAALGYQNINLKTGDAFSLWEEASPFDIILIHGAVTSVPADLTRQLAVGGKLVTPISDESGFQLLILIERGVPSFSVKSLGTGFFSSLGGF